MRLRSTARGLAAAVLATSACLAGCTDTVGGKGTALAPACPAAFFAAPGSGEGLANPAPSAVPDGLSAADVAAYGVTMTVFTSALVEIAGKGHVTTAALDYPAIPSNAYLGARGLSPALDKSERAGATALVTAVRARWTRSCPARPILLAGYSQGAEVVVRAVGELTAAQQKHVSVVLFGNPSYEPGEPGDYPGHTGAAGLRPTFLDGQAFRLPEPVRRRTLDVCAPGDPVCGVQAGLLTVVQRLYWVYRHAGIHSTAYRTDAGGYTRHAAQFLWAHRTVK
ncbi:cutinase family protein [uncultured Jatrophihabitans sp.]|uniref:cutinase family protein n=1 Tax=uncultured Jatrophihabitans sp. TaxID=1610747 RepID=UPI0035CC8EBE